MGSGVVALNLAPPRAILADTNEHIVRLYRGIFDGEISAGMVRTHLEENGKILLQAGGEYYYEVRQRFNDTGSSLDFLFLNRSCFNGVMRFNGKGKFNVPFCHKPDRFAKSYVTKIVNQVNWMARQMRGRDWKFLFQPWSDTLALAGAGDFVYLDPPYIGRHTDYFNAWDETDACEHVLRDPRPSPAAMPCLCGWKIGTAATHISKSVGVEWICGSVATSTMSALRSPYGAQWTKPC